MFGVLEVVNRTRNFAKFTPFIRLLAGGRLLEPIWEADRLVAATYSTFGTDLHDGLSAAFLDATEAFPCVMSDQMMLILAPKVAVEALDHLAHTSDSAIEPDLEVEVSGPLVDHLDRCGDEMFLRTVAVWVPRFETVGADDLGEVFALADRSGVSPEDVSRMVCAIPGVVGGPGIDSVEIAAAVRAVETAIS